MTAKPESILTQSTSKMGNAADCTTHRVTGGIGDGKDAFISENEIPLEAETILSRAMHEVSNHDRNAILEEIHGVHCLAVPESPESIAHALAKFDQVLQEENCQNNHFGSDGIDSIDSSENSKNLFYSYNMILAKRRKLQDELLRNPDNKVRGFGKKLSYCQNHYAFDDPTFRLRFLRAELFNVRNAVVRYCNYLNFVHELWGSVALEREISLSDLDRQENILFRKGYYQLLPFRDRSGRRIITILGGMGHEVDKIARVSASFVQNLTLFVEKASNAHPPPDAVVDVF